VNFNGTGKKGVDINLHLLKQEIMGGKALGKDFPELRDTFLYSVAEIHTRNDVDVLFESLKGIVEGSM